MSIAGSRPEAAVPGSAFQAPGAPTSLGPASPERGPQAPRRRTRLVRWRGLIPASLLVIALTVAWLVFGGRVVKAVVEEAGTETLGAAVEVAGVQIEERSAAVELRGLAIADPFDQHRNLVEAGVVRVELEPEPLLERKIVVRRLLVRDVRTGTRRLTPAPRVTAGGFAPRALAEMDRWSKQFQVPLLWLTPIDTIKAIVLDPAQLQGVGAALALAARTDSARRTVEQAYEAIRVRETLDTARALLTRLRGANARTLGVTGLTAAVADVRRVAAQVDSARRRVEALERSARAGIEQLNGGIPAIDDARRADYERVRGLLRLPSFDSPQIGAALFGRATIDRFEQALYWTALAREYAPPGLVPRESTGPKRLRRSGTTVHFVKREAYPRFLIQRADVDLAVSGGAARGGYVVAATDLTTEPTVVGRPARFALRREAGGSAVESLRASGLLDHVGARPRDVVAADAAGVLLPSIPLPLLPLRAQPGRGTSELRLVLDGDELSARWTVRSRELKWTTDSTRARALNTLESLVARAIGGVRDFDLTAELSGPVRAPRLAVRSNLDGVVAARLREVAGEEVDRAMARARAQVDRLVEEKAAPARTRVAELRGDVDRRIAEGKTQLEEERQKLDAQLKALVPRL